MDGVMDFVAFAFKLYVLKHGLGLAGLAALPRN